MDDNFAHLTRLSQKPGVQSTLILSRDTGAIVRASGLESRSNDANPDSTLPPSNSGNNDSVPAGTERATGRIRNAEDIAALVMGFVKATGGMVQELNGVEDDELKLLRIRTKRNEIVIVPGMSPPNVCPIDGF